MSSTVCIRLAKAVAYVSAKAQSLQIIITASAFPKLSDGPTVPDEVHIPSGAYPALIVKPTFSDRGDCPANTAISMSVRMSAYISPPFSTIISCTPNFSLTSMPISRATAPATALMGPMPERTATSAISRKITGAVGCASCGTNAFK